AVGLATEVPSHNLREVAAAAVALIRDAKLSDDELATLVPGPDYPGGGQIISNAEDIRAAYASGRGSLKVRALWKIEDLARGQWQLVVTELPPGTSAQKVLEEIEELTNPKVKAGKKTLSAEQTQLKATVLAVLDAVRDESSKDAPVRIVFEPKTSRIEQQDLINTLLAHTSLESSTPINLTMVGADGRPTQKSLRQLARLEAIKNEQELKELRIEQGKLEDILNSPASLKRTVIREIEADAKQHGDERRTLIQTEKRTVAEVKVADEPVTVVVSLK